MIDLRNANLKSLPAGVKVPTYDRSELTPGIVHIGLGNFHRAHQQWYLHRLLEAGKNRDWAVIGAGVRPEHRQMCERLEAQDFLTTLIELDPGGRSAEVVGSMIGVVPYDPENGPLIAQIADPAIRIVSLTVTEGGYFVDPATGGFDADHPDIRHDAENPDTPGTAFGAIAAALRQRRAAGTGPLTLQSCDNLQGNGDTLRQAVVSLARLSDPDLADWIDGACSFPNAMVDCIVPATGPRELALVETFGIADKAPVTHENFRQWVIEDDFCAGRPAWETVGATMTDAVDDFERMKLRMLNGGHQVIADLGELLSIETISGTMEHAGIRAVFEKIERQEIMPHVRPVSGFTPDEYLELLVSRFGNPMIVDTTRRVAFDGSSRHPGFLFASVRDNLASGGPVDGLALVSAAWARYCAGTRQDGSAIEPSDPFWSELQPKALQARDNPAIWLTTDRTYGDLAEAAPFTEAFDRWLRQIWDEGIEAAMTAYLDR